MRAAERWSADFGKVAKSCQASKGHFKALKEQHSGAEAQSEADRCQRDNAPWLINARP